ncbi:MAG: DUF58 domain-containing protein [Myxococcota bacterium]
MTVSPRMFWILGLGVGLALLPIVVHPQTWPAVVALWLATGAATLFELVSLWRARPELATVEAPPQVDVGDPFDVGIALRIGGRFPLRAMLRAEVETPLLSGPDIAVTVAGRPAQSELVVEAPHRGTGRVAGVWTKLDGPLGLLQRIDRHPVDQQVRVVPNRRLVRELTLHHYGAQVTEGSKVERIAGEGTEFDAMVGYVAGMDHRQVDWKSSARHQSLRVRRYRLEKNQRLVVCVDTGRSMVDPIDGMTRLDHAIVGALTLARVALRAGDLVGLHAYASEPRSWVAPAGTLRQMPRLDGALAELAPEPEETNHVLGLHTLVTRLRRRSLIVVFAEFSDATTAELMVESVARLVRRHLVVFVALDDPIVERPFAAEPSRAVDLAAAVIAGHVRRDRQRVLRRLERMGVDVVQGPPGPATLGLLKRYVEVKRKGQLG